MDDQKLLDRINCNSAILCGKPIIRGRRLAVEHVLNMLAVGDTNEEILAGFPWLELADIQACLMYTSRTIGIERHAPLMTGPKAPAGVV